MAFTVHVARNDGRAAKPETSIGVDVGMKNLAVTSDVVPGITDAQARVPNSRHYQRVRRHRRRLAKTTRLEARVAAIRNDGLHKLTSALSTQYSTIVVEDLNVVGMLKNRRLAKHIADAGFGELCRQLAYKSRRHGGTLVVADRVIEVDREESNSEAHQAGSLRMLDEAGELLAVWDGLPARGFGGTADVVATARARAMPVTALCPEGARRP